MTLNLTERIDALKDYTSKGWEEFRKNPSKQILVAARQFCEDYWDLGMAMGGITLLEGETDSNRIAIGIFMGLTGVLYGSLVDEDRPYRLGRNTCGTLSLLLAHPLSSEQWAAVSWTMLYAITPACEYFRLRSNPDSLLSKLITNEKKYLENPRPCPTSPTE